MDAVDFPDRKKLFISFCLDLVWFDLVLWEIGLKATYVLFKCWVLDYTKVDDDAYIPKVCAKC